MEAPLCGRFSFMGGAFRPLKPRQRGPRRLNLPALTRFGLENAWVSSYFKARCVCEVAWLEKSSNWELASRLIRPDWRERDANWPHTAPYLQFDPLISTRTWMSLSRLARRTLRDVLAQNVPDARHPGRHAGAFLARGRRACLAGESVVGGPALLRTECVRDGGRCLSQRKPYFCSSWQVDALLHTRGVFMPLSARKCN